MRVLVLGLGFFGRNWLREVLACPECEVAAIVAKHPDLLAAVGQEFTIPPSKRFATIEEGLDRSQAQAVIVALPEMVHKAAIREARRPETDVEDNVRSLAMVAAAIASVEKRQPVAVAPLVAEALAA